MHRLWGPSPATGGAPEDGPALLHRRADLRPGSRRGQRRQEIVVDLSTLRLARELEVQVGLDAEAETCSDAPSHTHKWALKVVRARFEVAPLPPGETASWQCPFCPQGLVAAATGKAAQYARRCHWERCHPDKPWKAFVVSGAQRIRTYQQRGVVGTRNAGAARRIQAIRSGVAKPHQPVFFQHRVGKRKGRTDLFCVKCRAVGTSPSDLASKRCTDSARKPRDLTWRITELRKAKRTAPMDQRPAFETLIELFSKEPAEGIIAAPQRHASTAAAVAAASTQRSAATSASRTGTDLAHQQQ